MLDYVYKAAANAALYELESHDEFGTLDVSPVTQPAAG